MPPGDVLRPGVQLNAVAVTHDHAVERVLATWSVHCEHPAVLRRKLPLKPCTPVGLVHHCWGSRRRRYRRCFYNGRLPRNWGGRDGVARRAGRSNHLQGCRASPQATSILPSNSTLSYGVMGMREAFRDRRMPPSWQFWWPCIPVVQRYHPRREGDQ